MSNKNYVEVDLQLSRDFEGDTIQFYYGTPDGYKIQRDGRYTERLTLDTFDKIRPHTLTSVARHRAYELGYGIYHSDTLLHGLPHQLTQLALKNFAYLREKSTAERAAMYPHLGIVIMDAVVEIALAETAEPKHLVLDGDEQRRFSDMTAKRKILHL